MFTAPKASLVMTGAVSGSGCLSAFPAGNGRSERHGAPEFRMPSFRSRSVPRLARSMSLLMSGMMHESVREVCELPVAERRKGE
jgi:hypothetical protein